MAHYVNWIILLLIIIVIRDEVNVLPELNTISVIHGRPDAAETTVVDRTFDDDRQNTDHHEADLYHVCPHHGLHAALYADHTRNSRK